MLYVLEPVRNYWGRDLDGEIQALDYMLQHLETLWPNTINRIILRPHPSDPHGKYDCYLKVDQRIEVDQSVDISQAISQADLVVGVESFALTLALAAGRPVFSSLPPWAPALRLPQEGIQQIRQLCPI
jgi:ADP-heptose:LPS heptosyltransferase